MDEWKVLIPVSCWQIVTLVLIFKPDLYEWRIEINKILLCYSSTKLRLTLGRSYEIKSLWIEVMQIYKGNIWQVYWTIINGKHVHTSRNCLLQPVLKMSTTSSKENLNSGLQVPEYLAQCNSDVISWMSFMITASQLTKGMQFAFVNVSFQCSPQIRVWGVTSGNGVHGW